MLHARSVRKTRMKTTQQIAVHLECNWNVSIQYVYNCVYIECHGMNGM